MKLTLGFSPCPNDTFIFDALIHHKIDTGDLTFDVLFDDVETLNKKAAEGILDITKLSFFALTRLADKYLLMDAGSALGFGVGPMLISSRPASDLFLDMDGKKILDPQLRVGIPGINTTANLLLEIAHPHLKNKQSMVFSDIESALLNNEIDLGLIIHENRFTYAEKGLEKVQDLGQFWEECTGCAIPLGGIVINERIPKEVQLKVQDAIRRSVEYAFAHPRSGLDFISAHAQEMEESVMFQHIDLYVNQYSVSLGETGKKAIDTLFKAAVGLGLVDPSSEPRYVTG